MGVDAAQQSSARPPSILAGLALAVTACATHLPEEAVTVRLERAAPLPPEVVSPQAPRPVAPAGWIRVEPGTFKMGSPPDELGRDHVETLHKVTITRPYWLKATEVTWAEWGTVMGATTSVCGEHCGADRPADNKSWYHALVYCNALSKREGLEPCYLDGDKEYDMESARAWRAPTWPKGLDCAGYRLPTEAEWEFAARAGTTTAFYTGAISKAGCEVDANLDQAGWYCGNAIGPLPIDRSAKRSRNGAGTQPVKQKAPNAWGFYDMLGNVWEWVWDSWDGRADYGTAARRDPVGPSVGELRIARGGSYYFPAASSRAASRNYFAPYDLVDNLGFRPARSVR